jgi:hypothetical protein
LGSGHALSEITNDADRAHLAAPPKSSGHVTLNISARRGRYIADQNANRIQVTTSGSS